METVHPAEGASLDAANPGRGLYARVFLCEALGHSACEGRFGPRGPAAGSRARRPSVFKDRLNPRTNAMNIENQPTVAQQAGSPFHGIVDTEGRIVSNWGQHRTTTPAVYAEPISYGDVQAV